MPSEQHTFASILEVPAELRDALRTNDTAAVHVERLSYSHRKEYLDPIAGARRDETRARRGAKTVETLTSGATAILCHSKATATEQWKPGRMSSPSSSSFRLNVVGVSSPGRHTSIVRRVGH